MIEVVEKVGCALNEMEKSNSMFCKNYFFIVLLLFVHICFAQGQSRIAHDMSQDILQTLLVECASSHNYASEDCHFVLEIPYVKSTEVSAAMPDLPQNVTFVSMRLSDYSDFEKTSGANGTKIELVLHFAEPGAYTVNPLEVTIKKRAYAIPFCRIEITENPKTMLPLLVVDFENGVSVSLQGASTSLPQKTEPLFSVPAFACVRFTVSLQYALQLVSLYWTTPKDALFTEIERYEFSQSAANGEVSPESKIPIAQFEWQPLVRGEAAFPFLKITAAAYNGSQVELYLPDYFITVTEPAFQKVVPPAQNDFFSDAFSVSSIERGVPIRLSPSKADCEKIAELRTKERRDVPFGNAKKERVEFEKSVGMLMANDEPLYFARTFFAFFAVFFVVLLFFSIAIKRIPNAIAVLCSIFVIVFVVLFSLSVKSLSVKYGIFAGGGLRSVPEENANAFESMESGVRVKVEHKTGEWLYISLGNSGGWTNESNVILIDEE